MYRNASAIFDDLRLESISIVGRIVNHLVNLTRLILAFFAHTFSTVLASIYDELTEKYFFNH